MNSDATSRILAVALTVLLLTSSLPVSVTATDRTSPPPSDSQSTGGSDSAPHVSGQTGASQPIPDSSPPLDTYPDLHNLSISYTVENNSDGGIRLNVSASGDIQKDEYPRNYPVAVTVYDSNGDPLITRKVHLSPDISSGFEETQTLRGHVNFNIQFIQDGNTSRSLTVVAKSLRDSTQDSLALTETVVGASEQQGAQATGSVTSQEVNEPPSEVSFVGRFRASDPNTSKQYLESYSIPLEDPSASVNHFVNMRASNENATRIMAQGGRLAMATSTTGIPNGSTQTVVITYRALSSHNVSVTPVTANGKPLHPGRSNSYVLPSDPNQSDHCQPGDHYDLCVFTLSDQEMQQVNSNHELYLKYSSPEDASLNVFCQAIITGTLRPGMQTCGQETVGNYVDGYIYNMSGRGNNSSNFKWSTEPTVSLGEDVDLNLTLGNGGTKTFNGRVRVFSASNVSYSSTETIEWRDMSPDWTGSKSFSASYDPTELVLNLDADYNGYPLTVNVTNEHGEKYSTTVSSSDENSNGIVKLTDLESQMTNSGDQYTVEISASTSDPHINKVNITAKSAERDASATKSVSIQSGSLKTVRVNSLNTGNTFTTVEYVALLCGDEIPIGSCTIDNNDGLSTISVQVGRISSDNESPAGDTGGPYRAELPIIGYETVQTGVETKQLANEPLGPGWNRSDQPVSTGNSMQTETVTVYNVSISTGNPVSDYKDEAKAKLSTAPGSIGWSMVGDPRIVENETTVRIQSSRPDGTGWQRSKEPVSTSETGKYEYGWFTTTLIQTGEGTKIKSSDASANGWTIVRPYERRQKTIVLRTVKQHVDPDECLPIESNNRGCYMAETFTERDTRLPSTIASTAPDANLWKKSDRSDPEVVRKVVGGKKKKAYVKPGDGWHKIVDNTDKKDVFWKPKYGDKRKVYTWVKTKNVTQYKHQRPNEKKIYRWTKKTYDLVYTFETPTEGEKVYEWTRPSTSQAPIYGNQTVWFDVSDSHDLPRAAPSGIKYYEWTIGGTSVRTYWDGGVHTSPPESRSCPSGYSNKTTSRQVRSGELIVVTCEDDSSSNSFVLKTGRKYTKLGSYSPTLGMIDNAGNWMNETDATVNVVPCEGDTCGVSQRRLSLNVVGRTRKTDIKHGIVRFTLNVSGPEKLPQKWRIMVKPADKLSAAGGCPTTHHRNRTTKTVENKTATERERQVLNCVRDDPLDNYPEGSPKAPSSFVLKEDPSGGTRFGGDEWYYFKVPNGSARHCASDYDRNFTATQYQCNATDTIDSYVLANRSSSSDDWTYKSVISGTYTSCPDGYVSNTKYVNSSESKLGQSGIQVECNRLEITSFQLQARYVVESYQSLSSSTVAQIGECAIGYSTSYQADGSVDCVKNRDNGPSSYTLQNSSGDYQSSPAGAYRQCPDGWKTSYNEYREEAIVCVDGDNWFSLARLDLGAWTSQSVPSSALGFNPHAKKTVWESQYITNGSENVTVIINPRKNDAITVGNNTFTFIAEPVRKNEVTDSDKASAKITVKERVQLCRASQGSHVPKKTKGPHECIGLDSDFDGYPDYVAPKYFIENGNEHLYNLNDVCPYNPDLPKQTGKNLTLMTEAELKELYHVEVGNSPCSQGASKLDAETYTITWGSSSWDKAQKSSGVRHSTASVDSRDIQYGHGNHLVLGYSLAKSASVNDDLVAYYSLNEQAADDKNNRDKYRPVHDIWTTSSEPQYNGYHWTRNPCKPKFNVFSRYSCESPWFDAPANKYGYFDRGSYINTTYIRSYNRCSDSNPDDGVMADYDTPNCIYLDENWHGSLSDGNWYGSLPHDRWRTQTEGLFGTNAYTFQEHNWVELSGGHPGGSANLDASPSTNLTTRLLHESPGGEPSNGSYTISFWFKAANPSDALMYSSEDMNKPENTIFSINRPHDNQDNMDLHYMYTEHVYGDTKVPSVGWPTNVNEDLLSRWYQQEKYESGSAHAPGFYAYSDEWMSGGENAKWHHITIVRATQNDAGALPGTSRQGVALYVDGQLEYTFTTANDWDDGTWRDGRALDPFDLDAAKSGSDPKGDPNTYASSTNEYGVCPYDCVDPINPSDQPYTVASPLGDISPNSRFIFGAQWKSEGGVVGDRKWRTERGLNGHIDEIRVYDRPLSEKRVKQLYINDGFLKTSTQNLPNQVSATSGSDFNLTMSGSVEGGVVRVRVIPCPSGSCQPSNAGTATVASASDTKGVPVEGLSLSEPTNKFKLNISLRGYEPSDTPVVKDVTLQYSPSRQNTCRDVLQSQPGLIGTPNGRFEVALLDDSGSTHNTTVGCDMALSGGGWTKFWYYEENVSNESGPDPTINGALLEKELWNCKGDDTAERTDKCMGRLNFVNANENKSILVKATGENGSVEYAIWRFNGSNPVATDALDAFDNGTKHTSTGVCWNAYHYSNDYLSFGADGSSCKNTFVYDGNAMSIVNSTTAEYAFHVVKNSDGTVTIKEALGLQDVQKLEFYYREKGPTE